ncbi:hypothetical protein NQ315_003508 [Exocentrus adspersus]|uniref:C2H2-type domain-containing protein n=1 Tax=Exocentrus adspersus TaxID=1586481 RepID=A0AAV8V592_9CUCU|nr:hypothetical protein NQ315_003508 [Exocentrus adspersus]
MYRIKKFRELKTRKKGTNESKIMCVLCCNTCSKKALEDTEELVKEVLNVVLLETNLTTTKRSAMCLKCSQRVNNIFEFKSGCLYVEDFVTPFVSTEEGKQIDLKEVYIKEKGNKDLIDALLGRDLCRLCLSVVDNECVYLDSSDLHVTFIKDMIKRCIPEINVNNTKNAIICGTCVSCLKDYYNFMESYSESGSTSHFSSQTTGRSMKDETELTYLPAKWKGALKKHTLIHKNPSEIEWFKCHLCDYEAKQKVHLKRHNMAIHKKPWEIEWFKCHLCDFKSKQKADLRRHTLIHKDPSEIEWFECDSCNFKSKYKGSLKVHIISVHRSR